MKKLLFATVFASTALASSMGCNTDTLTGLHFGLGVSVLFDKYEADVDVGTIVDKTKFTLKQVDVAVAKTNAELTATLGDVNAWIHTNVVAKNNEATGAELISNAVAATAVVRTIANNGAAFIKRNTLKKRTTNCGGEVKLAYFHDFGNHLMVGVDLTGIIASKNKKTVSVSPSTLQAATANYYTISNNGKVIAKSTAAANSADNIKFEDSAALAIGTLEVSNKYGLENANPGFDNIMPITGNEPANMYLKTAIDAAGELTFEKGVFNPRLAFIVGGTVYGWFAGLRMGMSYTTGKVYAKGLGQDKISKTVSISSPLIGLHLMKQMKIAGNNDAHLYLTADWNIGDGRRSVYMNGVRNFKQS